MSYNPKNLKDKIDRILEQNKRYQQQIPQNFIKGWRQCVSQSTQPKSSVHANQMSNKNNLQINTNNSYCKARSANSWAGDSGNTKLRISTTPNSQSSNNNKENVFRRNEFLSTKNSSVKGNKKKIEYNFNLTNDGITLKNQNLSYYQNYVNKSNLDKNSSLAQNDVSYQNKSPSIDNSKTFLISKQHDNQVNGSKDTYILNDSNSYNNQTCISALQQNINVGNNSNVQINKSLNSSQNGGTQNKNGNLNLTSSSLQSTAAKNQKEILKQNQAFNNSSSFVNTNSPVASGVNKLLQNGSILASNSKIAASPQSEIVNQLIKIIEQDKKYSAKQFQQFQNQQHQNSYEGIRKRESFSLQMKQASQNIDAPTISKRGSNFGLLDSNNNYQNSEEDNNQKVRELKTKYHLRDAILRQEIKRLEQENIMLKSTNKQLDEEVNRYRNIRTMENKYIKKLEQELIEEKQKYQVNFKKIANGECISSNSLVSSSGGGGNASNNNHVSFSNQSNGLSTYQVQLRNEPITQQNAFQVAKYQEKLIQTLSEKVSELMNEKEYLEQILKNLLLKNEMEKQNKYESLSFEISQQKPSYLNTSFSDNSCFAQFKASASNSSYPNIQTNLQQINVNVSQSKIHPQPVLNQNQHLANNQLACHQQISQIKEEYMEESSRAKTSQTSSQQQSQQQAQQINNNNLQQLQQQKENVNILNNILEKNKNLQNVNNTNQQFPNSRNSETPRQNQKRQQSGSKDSSYPPQAPSSLNSIKRYTNRKYQQDSSEKNSNTNSIDGFIFGPPKSAHQCSYEEQLINQQQQNNKVIFLENQENEEFYWDPYHDEIVINEVQLKNLIEDYKRRAQKVDLL
ncbi:hypothetical protein TTHERM_00566900 (macronuclear) [Tetrahymena thermophila SB210]|uniref:Uncharacterized protein n=1 Tax=Tetrahymena thermophila (strain SB210) TaxID=312017 RepID=I7MLE2_TETTS|nr:hypothetical protein TTHERM_00566900 [Tetrahymena thermophila SB210]EAS01846.1 hypothetical protein TTHERM_00566900 [Tetrahymena thermophila SB210]|eukprot:XP_001022091.1 hypothetical protein TTHERM_00566900 [Tetrahymena thermophila SB210]